MENSIRKSLTIVLSSIMFLGALFGCVVAEDTSNNSVEVEVKQDTEFGGVYMMISPQDFIDAGFQYGDSCTLSFSTGVSYENVPFYSGFYGHTGELAIVAYQGIDYLQAARCSGDSLWKEAECKEGETATITCSEKEKYLSEQKAMDMTYSNDKEDFIDDKTFTNFRAISCKNFVSDLFYRGASPVNNEYSRATSVDKLLSKNQIKFVLDLADTEEKLEKYQNNSDFNSEYFLSLYDKNCVSLVGLNAAYRSDEFRSKLTNAIQKMLEKEGPYYINCTEGKDRTGFVCILLECAAGCPLEDIEADYMKSYENYFGVTKENNMITYQTILDLRFYDMMQWLTNSSTNEEVKEANLEKAAENYFTQAGLTEKEFENLQQLVKNGK